MSGYAVTGQLIAHRGYGARYPENTLAGLRAALEAGTDYVEFDVQFSADGVPVLMHDADLERTTGVAERVDACTAEELQALSAGEPARFGSQFAKEPVPTLQAALGLLAYWPEACFLVEIKSETIVRLGVEPVAARLAEELAAWNGRCVLIAFDSRVLAAARRHGVSRIGWVIERFDDAARQTAESLRPELLVCDYRKLPDGTNALWPGPWAWALYDICDPALARHWLERGVGFIETWDVGGLQQVLNGNRPVY